MSQPARVLVTRPQPAASRTAAALAAMGLEPVIHPLMETRALRWALPELLPPALLMTSAAAARHAGPVAEALLGLPLFCVGDATTAAARAAGFARAVRAGAHVAEAMAMLAAAGHARALHLAGRDLTDATPPPGLTLEVRTVYDAVLLPLEVRNDLAAVLLYSPRSAAHFASEWARAGRAPDLLLAALSPAVLAAAGPGWTRHVVAARPDEPSLLAALATAGL